MKKKAMFTLVLIIGLIACQRTQQADQVVSSDIHQDYKQWANEKSWQWYNEQEWIIGANFTPNTAINQIEFWQEDTYDPITIDRELGYARDIGFNTMRVYLHYLVWVRNPEEMKKRMDDFLSISERHGIRIMFVLFDDCWNDNPNLGKQPEPEFGVHNSGWAQCPGGSLVDDVALFPVLKAYTQDIMSHFSNDDRVLMWDLYNEPGNFDILERSLPLLKSVIQSARDVNVQQPITIGLWNWGEEFSSFNKVQADNSDIITFHHYGTHDELLKLLDDLKQYERPMICTEYMARTRENTFQTHLPVFKRENIGAINWGLVSGKTNTIYMWDSVYTAEPEVWFHDIFRKDGTPYDSAEIALIKELVNKN